MNVQFALSFVWTTTDFHLQISFHCRCRRRRRLQFARAVTQEFIMCFINRVDFNVLQ